MGIGGLAGEFSAVGGLVEPARGVLLLVPCAPTAGTRFRRLMTVFFMATGRGTPCSL